MKTFKQLSTQIPLFHLANLPKNSVPLTENKVSRANDMYCV